MNEKQLQVLRDLFYEWFYDYYSDECSCKDDYSRFEEQNKERIEEDFFNFIWGER